MQAPLIKIGELKEARSLSEFGQVGYETKNHANLLFVRVAGFITDIIGREDRGYLFLRVDDGSGSILVKFFIKDNDQLKELERFKQWDFVLVLGMLKHWKDEIYLQPFSVIPLNFEEEIYYRGKLLVTFYEGGS